MGVYLYGLKKLKNPIRVQVPEATWPVLIEYGFGYLYKMTHDDWGTEKVQPIKTRIENQFAGDWGTGMKPRWVKMEEETTEAGQHICKATQPIWYDCRKPPASAVRVLTELLNEDKERGNLWRTQSQGMWDTAQQLKAQGAEVIT
jgi:hypothetical protein